MHKPVLHGDLPDDYSEEDNYRGYVERVIKKRLQEFDKELCHMSMQLARKMCNDEKRNFGESFATPLGQFRTMRNDLIYRVMDKVWAEIEDSHVEK